MSNSIGFISKMTIVFILLLLTLVYWIIPTTKISRKIVLSEKVFITTQILGVTSGITGLAFTVFYPEGIINLHLWELIILPYVMIQTYWLVVMKIKKSVEIIDEKLESNMTKAGGITFGISIPIMIFLFSLYQNQQINGLLWMPYYLFGTLLIFSLSIIILFKRA